MSGKAHRATRIVAVVGFGIVCMMGPAMAGHSLEVTLAAALLGRSANAADCPPHPYPCGDEWPAGLEGPFGLKEILYVRVPSFDGVELEGWIGLPDLPDGPDGEPVRAPVAVTSSPYNGQCSGDPSPNFNCTLSPANTEYWWADPPVQPLGAPGPPLSWGTTVTPIGLVQRGYAAAFFSVRGTGKSGGCFDWYGESEQKDQGVIVDWLAAQPWSNGRVAMGGLSYLSGTALSGGLTAGESLKTIVTTGIVSDVYTQLATPQGAVRTLIPSAVATRHTQLTFLPPLVPLILADAPDYFASHADVILERACPGVLEVLLEAPKSQVGDVRDQLFYDERRLIDRYEGITASVLMAHGFLDRPGHNFQSHAMWRVLWNAPKRQIEGQWGHTYPDGPANASLDPGWTSHEWHDVVFGWLDYWLKGIGSPQRLGKVDYQDGTGAWHESDAWPPEEGRDEVLYLSGDAVSGSQGTASRSFRSAPNPQNSYHNLPWAGSWVGVIPPYRPWAAVCPGATAGAPLDTAGLLYLSGAVAEPVVIAGNPFAYLAIESDLPGGVVNLHVLDIGPDFSCDAAGQARGIRVLTSGAADLRFHGGNFVAADFPVGVPVSVRIDLWDLADVLAPGHRLGVVIGYGDGLIGWSGQPYFPRITVHATGDARSSHLVIPVVEGTLGGAEPEIPYPPRPFIPDA